MMRAALTELARRLRRQEEAAELIEDEDDWYSWDQTPTYVTQTWTDPEPDFVFVYGILLRDARIPATLADHRLMMWGNANVVEEEGRIVYGGLVKVDGRQLRTYDTIEGYNEFAPEHGYYRREIVTVRSLNDEMVEAWVYKMNDHRFVVGGHRFDPSYIAYLAEQYRRLNHPAAALAEVA